jgi:hypothetical protein
MAALPQRLRHSLLVTLLDGLRREIRLERRNPVRQKPCEALWQRCGPIRLAHLRVSRPIKKPIPSAIKSDWPGFSPI